jgi:hypothetical protein
MEEEINFHQHYGCLVNGLHYVFRGSKKYKYGESSKNVNLLFREKEKKTHL